MHLGVRRPHDVPGGLILEVLNLARSNSRKQQTPSDARDEQTPCYDSLHLRTFKNKGRSRGAPRVLLVSFSVFVRWLLTLHRAMVGLILCPQGRTTCSIAGLHRLSTWNSCTIFVPAHHLKAYFDMRRTGEAHRLKRDLGQATPRDPPSTPLHRLPVAVHACDVDLLIPPGVRFDDTFTKQKCIFLARINERGARCFYDVSQRLSVYR